MILVVGSSVEMDMATGDAMVLFVGAVWRRASPHERMGKGPELTVPFTMYPMTIDKMASLSSTTSVQSEMNRNKWEKTYSIAFVEKVRLTADFCNFRRGLNA